MNKIVFSVKQFALILYCIVAILPSVFANVIEDNRSYSKSTAVSKSVLKERLQNMSSVIDIRYTDVTERKINEYVHKGRRGSEELLGRVSMYFPTIENVLWEKNLPEIIKYIPIIESSLRPHARSRANAVGMWQFMKPTGKMYDLKINKTIDERKDPVKATKAAGEYFLDLYEMFDDWTLAIAAYNCGPGNVRKAIRRSGGKNNYWEIRKYLPKETRSYVPKLIAAMYLMKYYHIHDIQPATIADELMYTTTVTVHKNISLQDVSKHIGVDALTLQLLNPEYLKKYIPANKSGNELRLPTFSLVHYFEHYEPATFNKMIADQKKREAEQLTPPRLSINGLDHLAVIDPKLIKYPRRKTKSI